MSGVPVGSPVVPFIRPRLLLLDTGGEGPAPAGSSWAMATFGDDAAFVWGFELVPLVVQAVVAMWPRIRKASSVASQRAHMSRMVLLFGPAVVPGGPDQQAAGVGVACFW